MTLIYGLRAVGDPEIRYIGRTDYDPSARLTKHIQNAERGYPPKISTWILAAGAVEIVPLFECSPDVAATAERAAVHRYHQLGHRLTNSHLIPRAEKRLSESPGA